MKDFHTWTQEMAGSIPDASTVVLNTATHSELYSELQLRVMLADKLFPNPRTSHQCEQWVKQFRVMVSTSEFGAVLYNSGPLARLLSNAPLASSYAAAETLNDEITFINAVRKLAATGGL